MPRTLALVFLTLCFCRGAASQSHLLVGRLVDVSRRPPAPVGGAKITVLYTRQEAISKPDGLFQFTLPAAMLAGSEVQIEVKAGSLRVYQPRNGMLAVPASGAKPVEVQLLPAGSKLFLEPAAIEALLAQASKPPPNAEHEEPGRPAEREPRLTRFLRLWAADYGLGLEEVEREVKAWGDQIRAKREDASVRQRALAEFQAEHFAQAAALFEESASAEAMALDRIEAERKERDLAERTVLRRFLDDKIREAEALTQGLKYEEAARVLDGAAKRVSRDRYATWWAEMQVRWGLALNVAGSFGEAKQSIASLRTAVSALQNALGIRTRESLPREWAETQNIMGFVYLSLGERMSGTERVEIERAAVNAFQDALLVRTKESLPQDWAMTLNNLGVAYMVLSGRQGWTEGAGSVRASITALQHALQVRTKESLPQDWVQTQTNLGAAYLSLGARQSGTEAEESLRTAVTAYRNALEVQTKESLPKDWATTQNSLGGAYLSLGLRQSGSERVESLRGAVTAYQNALQVRTRESAPQDWATTQISLRAAYQELGGAYRGLAERASGPAGLDSLRAAVAAYQNALQIQARESIPQAWAMTQNSLGVTYLGLGERLDGAEGAESLRAAITALQNALLVRTKESLPFEWAETWNNLAKAYVSQREWEKAAQAAENVLTLYPTHIEAAARAEAIYQNRLFRFDRAFEINAKRSGRGDGLQFEGDDNILDFIETDLTTARFAGCVTFSAALRNSISGKDQRLVLTSLRFACLAADQKTEDAVTAGRELAKDLSGLDKIHWTFDGVKHFVSQNPAFAGKAAEWVRLFEALEQGDEAKARAALSALGVPG